MKVFLERPQIHQFKTAEDFVNEFQIGAGDFVLATKTIYNTFFQNLVTDATVKFKTDYGKGEPTDIMLDALLTDFRSGNYRRVIAIGGGAVIDMAKILLLKTDAMTTDIYKRKVELMKGYELIAVPTTCGAGSEVSNVSIVELTKEGTKLGLADDSIYADHAVLIPELLEVLPYHFFATSAIDAFIHAIESYVSPRANIYTRMFSKEAMKMIIEGFRKVAEDGPEARIPLLGDFLMASNLAGIAFGNAGTGTVHAMSYPLSGTYHVAHGEANYQFLTAVFKKYTAVKPAGEITELNAFLAGVLACDVEVVYEELEMLFSNIQNRKKLCTYGMKEEECQSFAESVTRGQQRLLNQSYVKFNTEEICALYKKLYK